MFEKRNAAMFDEEASIEFVNQVTSKTVASIANLSNPGDVDKWAVDENVQSDAVCESVQYGEKMWVLFVSLL